MSDDDLINTLTDDDPATRPDSDDYDVVFGSDAGRRVLADMVRRYGVGKPSFVFDKEGRFDLEASARADAAKAIVADILLKSKFKGEVAGREPRKAKRGTLGGIPTHTASI